MPPTRSQPRRCLLALAALVIAVALFGPVRAMAVPATSEPADPTAAGSEMTAGKAAVLGLVEGVTEFLPISSTGHLLVAQRLLGIGESDATKPAADAYAIAIQAGAILAVVLLYFRRLRSMVVGILGRDPEGRRVFTGLVLAFLPAVVIALAFERPIKDHLLGAGPVVIAWAVGGLVILLVAPRWERHAGGRALETISARQALVIGVVQCLALWPGTSRSLVTILAGLAVGLSLGAAVEFSFLLGLVTLGAATAYEALKDGSLMLDAYGWFNPLVGLVVAFVAAGVAIRWMVGYLQRHSLAIFGWYRLGAAAVATALIWAGTI
ncbi:undecaprenyl-diphosphate phosphatase [Rhabdothermincola sp.]|uniref:undecaprenyl-diphosphate phosphatase n=1 Tax=Rhabdothermincola sp. TaxID=2820405 RepID=UPI002FE2149F